MIVFVNIVVYLLLINYFFLNKIVRKNMKICIFCLWVGKILLFEFWCFYCWEFLCSEYVLYYNNLIFFDIYCVLKIKEVVNDVDIVYMLVFCEVYVFKKLKFYCDDYGVVVCDVCWKLYYCECFGLVMFEFEVDDIWYGDFL